MIALNLDGQQYTFEGIVNGIIVKEQHGEKGFGYDPIFLPDGYEQTFAETPLDLKNSISHRGNALRKMISYLSNL